LTLSLCGLGWLDETEVETIPGARLVSADVVESEEAQASARHRPEQVVTAELGYDEPIITNERQAAPRKPATTGSIPQALLDAGLAEDMHHAAGMLNKMPNAIRLDKEQALAWAAIYRAWRTSGKTSDEAAELATAGTKPE
jgi:hypothetical protein